jgi:colanic acid biosynthesis glycosyl transferase WcaI
VTGKPRLHVVLNVFHPDVAGGATVYTDLSFSLAREGFEVTVTAPVPFYPEWRDKSGRNGLKVWRYEESGTSIERYGLFIPRNPNSLIQRLLFEATFLVSVLRALPRMRKADVILAFNPLASGLAVAAIARRLFRIPLILNVQDITADAAASGGIARGWLSQGLLRRVEHWLFNQADYWTTISPVMVKRLETMRRRGQPIEYIPNWVGESLAREISACRRGNAERRQYARLQLLYAGNIGRKQNLIALCDALHASSLEFVFRICGSGAGAKDMSTWVNERSDARFSFEAILPEAGFARALTSCDYYVITESAGVGGSFIPSKLVAALMAGTPILGVCDPDSPLGEELRAAEPGLHLTWDVVGDVADRLKAVSPATYAAWAANAERRAELYNRQGLINRIAALVTAARTQGPGRTDAWR